MLAMRPQDVTTVVQISRENCFYGVDAASEALVKVGFPLHATLFSWGRSTEIVRFKIEVLETLLGAHHDSTLEQSVPLASVESVMSDYQDKLTLFREEVEHSFSEYLKLRKKFYCKQSQKIINCSNETVRAEIIRDYMKTVDDELTIHRKWQLPESCSCEDLKDILAGLKSLKLVHEAACDAYSARYENVEILFGNTVSDLNNILQKIFEQVSALSGDILFTENPDHIHATCARGDLSALERMLEMHHGNETIALYAQKIGPRALHIACLKNQLPMVKYLVETLNFTHRQDQFGYYPIDYAVIAIQKTQNNGSDIKELIYYLLANGAIVNARAPFGVTPLDIAVNLNHLDLVRFLCEQGAFVNGIVESAHFHKTPLHRAVEHKNIEIVRYLLEQGALPHLLDLDRTSALTQAFLDEEQKIIAEFWKHGFWLPKMMRSDLQAFTAGSTEQIFHQKISVLLQTGSLLFSDLEIYRESSQIDPDTPVFVESDFCRLDQLGLLQNPLYLQDRLQIVNRIMRLWFDRLHMKYVMGVSELKIKFLTKLLDDESFSETELSRVEQIYGSTVAVALYDFQKKQESKQLPSGVCVPERGFVIPKVPNQVIKLVSSPKTLGSSQAEFICQTNQSILGYQLIVLNMLLDMSSIDLNYLKDLKKKYVKELKDLLSNFLEQAQALCTDLKISYILKMHHFEHDLPQELCSLFCEKLAKDHALFVKWRPEQIPAKVIESVVVLKKESFDLELKYKRCFRVASELTDACKLFKPTEMLVQDLEMFMASKTQDTEIAFFERAHDEVYIMCAKGLVDSLRTYLSDSLPKTSAHFSLSLICPEALRVAYANAQWKMINFLTGEMRFQNNLSVLDSGGYSFVHYAFLCEDSQKKHQLLVALEKIKGLNFSMRSSFGFTPLDFSVIWDDQSAIDFLCNKAGLSANAADLFYWASENQQHFIVDRLLTGLLINPHVIMKVNRTPLINALLNNDLYMVKIFLDHGYWLNDKERKYLKDHWEAFCKNSPECANFLIDIDAAFSAVFDEYSSHDKALIFLGPKIVREVQEASTSRAVAIRPKTPGAQDWTPVQLQRVLLWIAPRLPQQIPRLPASLSGWIPDSSAITHLYNRLPSAPLGLGDSIRAFWDYNNEGDVRDASRRLQLTNGSHP